MEKGMVMDGLVIEKICEVLRSLAGGPGGQPKG